MARTGKAPTRLAVRTKITPRANSLLPAPGGRANQFLVKLVGSDTRSSRLGAAGKVGGVQISDKTVPGNSGRRQISPLRGYNGCGLYRHFTTYNIHTSRQIGPPLGPFIHFFLQAGQDSFDFDRTCLPGTHLKLHKHWAWPSLPVHPRVVMSLDRAWLAQAVGFTSPLQCRRPSGIYQAGFSPIVGMCLPSGHPILGLVRGMRPGRHGQFN